VGEVTTEDRAALGRIEAIIAENARLLGEEIVLGVRLRSDGVRIQVRQNGRWMRSQYRHYIDMASALRAAEESNVNARAFAKRRSVAS
jgi:hypothetical protein